MMKAGDTDGDGKISKDELMAWMTSCLGVMISFKRSSKKIVERYYQRLTLDFNTNKRICDEVAMIPSKKLRNKIAGFTTHMMKRISRGPVKGISLKLQEEEREKRLDYIPDISAVDIMIADGIEIDTDTREMLSSMDMQ